VTVDQREHVDLVGREVEQRLFEQSMRLELVHDRLCDRGCAVGQPVEQASVLDGLSGSVAREHDPAPPNAPIGILRGSSAFAPLHGVAAQMILGRVPCSHAGVHLGHRVRGHHLVDASE
jgi:hypothetical protein